MVALFIIAGSKPFKSFTFVNPSMRPNTNIGRMKKALVFQFWRLSHSYMYPRNLDHINSLLYFCFLAVRRIAKQIFGYEAEFFSLASQFEKKRRLWKWWEEHGRHGYGTVDKKVRIFRVLCLKVYFHQLSKQKLSTLILFWLPSHGRMGVN